MNFFLTFLIYEIYQKCSSLFENLLSKSKQKELSIENDNEFELWIVSDNNYKKISTIDCFSIKYCREIFKLSTKASIDNRIILFVMKIALRNAYVIHYLMSHIMHLDIAAIQWCKKLTFYNFQLKHRITFVMRNFVQIRNQIEKTQLDYLFVHELNDFCRLFVIIFRLQNIDKKMTCWIFFFCRFRISVSNWNIID